MKRILIADDDAAIRELLQFHLKTANFDVTKVKNGQEAVERAESETFDALLLDLMMPKLSGLEVTEKLREAGNVTPILILTAREDDDAKLRGLSSGADDYIEKNTPIPEIVQRLKGLIRRHQLYDKQRTADKKTSGLKIDEKRKSVSLDGSEIALTKREFDILKFLVKHEGEVVSRDALLQEFWGLTNAVAETRTMDVLISRLRKKLGGRYIRSKRGFGYSFDDTFES